MFGARTRGRVLLGPSPKTIPSSVQCAASVCSVQRSVQCCRVFCVRDAAKHHFPFGSPVNTRVRLAFSSPFSSPLLSSVDARRAYCTCRLRLVLSDCTCKYRETERSLIHITVTTKQHSAFPLPLLSPPSLRLRLTSAMSALPPTKNSRAPLPPISSAREEEAREGGGGETGDVLSDAADTLEAQVGAPFLPPLLPTPRDASFPSAE